MVHRERLYGLHYRFFSEFIILSDEASDFPHGNFDSPSIMINKKGNFSMFESLEEAIKKYKKLGFLQVKLHSDEERWC